VRFTFGEDTTLLGDAHEEAYIDEMHGNEERTDGKCHRCKKTNNADGEWKRKNSFEELRARSF
jgi:hypothetical protein